MSECNSKTTLKKHPVFSVYPIPLVPDLQIMQWYRRDTVHGTRLKNTSLRYTPGALVRRCTRLQYIPKALVPPRNLIFRIFSVLVPPGAPSSSTYSVSACWKVARTMLFGNKFLWRAGRKAFKSTICIIAFVTITTLITILLIIVIICVLKLHLYGRKSVYVHSLIRVLVSGILVQPFSFCWFE